MAEHFPPTQPIEELVSQVENFLQTHDDSISDIPTLCSTFLSQLEQIAPADNVSKRDIRRLKSRIRVRLNQARADTSADKSEQGDDQDPSSSLVEPSTDPPSIQEISSELVLIKARIDALNSERSPSPTVSSKSGMSGDNQAKGSLPPPSPTPGMPGGNQVQATDPNDPPFTPVDLDKCNQSDMSGDNQSGGKNLFTNGFFSSVGMSGDNRLGGPLIPTPAGMSGDNQQGVIFDLPRPTLPGMSGDNQARGLLVTSSQSHPFTSHSHLPPLSMSGDN